ncbi:MAG: hypothetical protein JW910_11075 [Anaerolineae bacterium]|nr:hypothetical protein [Anaerolineae bacterium]
MTITSEANPMTALSPFPFVVEAIPGTTYELDRRLPRWARRSHPIVRRHLGGFWKAQLPDTSTLIRAFLIQSALILFTILAPDLLEIAALAGIVSFVALPPLAVVYAQALYGIGSEAASSVIDEQEHQALDVLRTTPYPLRTILLSKIAASVWRQADRIDAVLLTTATLSLPPIILECASLYPPDDYPGVLQVLVIFTLGASMLRLIIEPVMAGAIGTVTGALGTFRISAALLAALTVSTYFVLVNLPRLLPLPPVWRLLVEAVLPLVLPVVITLVALPLAQRALIRD